MFVVIRNLSLLITTILLPSVQGADPVHWSFQPIQHPNPPELKEPGNAINPIDRFILARLEREGIRPSPSADRETLIRRVTLDLIGLPPTPQEVDDFVHDPSPDAYTRLVDRLLASPHYGERWARYWLDAARYADSDGYEKDSARPFAWRYREWVIWALNRDLPFDQFTIQQLAGDLLPNATVEQRVATGYHRNTLRNREGGVDQEQFRVEAVVDRVNTTGTVWLGLTVGCAQCHDHKYDPISQREYYQLFAFFNSDEEVDIPAPLPTQTTDYARKQKAYEAKHAELTQALKDRQKRLPELQKEWEESLSDQAVRKMRKDIRAILLTDPSRRTEEQRRRLAEQYAKIDFELAKLKKALADHEKTKPDPPKAQTLQLGKTRPTHVLERGDFLRPGEPVQPNTPSILPAMSKSTSPTRLDLARWLVDEENPLTARVIVNWVWQKYFGRGLVSTLNDFGRRGQKPTHPELLDWLARELMRQGWSLKALHRLIVTSATYRQSSHARPELWERDPLNELLARQNRLRLPAEIIRDSALAASGLLSTKIGGPSVRPPQPPGISELTYANSAKWSVSKGEDRYRRGLYIWFQRTSPFPMLMTFDSPDSNVCAVRRERSNTPLQALTLLNDVVFVECAQALGERLTAFPEDDPVARIEHGFRLCMGRKPSSAERERLLQLFHELHELTKADPEGSVKLVGREPKPDESLPETAAWIALARSLLNLDEFITRE